MNYYIQCWPTPQGTWIARVFRRGLIIASVDGLFSRRATITEVRVRAANSIRAMRGKEWS